MVVQAYFFVPWPVAHLMSKSKNYFFFLLLPSLPLVTSIHRPVPFFLSLLLLRINNNPTEEINVYQVDDDDDDDGRKCGSWRGGCDGKVKDTTGEGNESKSWEC